MQINLAIKFLLLTIIFFVAVSCVTAVDLRTNQMMIGGEVVDAKMIDGKLVGARLLSESNKVFLIESEITPIQGVTNGAEMSASTNVETKPILSHLDLLIDPATLPASGGGAGGMHGHIYMANSRNYKTPNVPSTNLVDILNSGKNIVVMILGNGPIYSSTNSGMNWQVISKAGYYKFQLGPGWIAAATIFPTLENQSTNVSSIPNWCVIGSNRDGSKLVISRDAENPAPFLNVRNVNGDLVISWPAVYSNFKLQMNTNLFSGSWVDVPDAAEQVGAENQVIVSNPNANNFYRLKSQ